MGFSSLVVAVILFACVGQMKAAVELKIPSPEFDSFNDVAGGAEGDTRAAFQTAPSPNVTASKLMTNFLRINPRLSADRVRRSSVIMEDIVIVMDGSSSVSRCEFNKGKTALHHLMKLAENYDHTKSAAVTFSTSATVNFKFLPCSSAANEVTQISYPGGMTNTQAGLTEARELFDDPSSGRRISAKKMVFLVTDGHSNVDTRLTIPKADALKNSGVMIFVVAVGTYIDGIDEMVKVASYPPAYYMFRVKNLQQFWNVIKLVIKEVAPRKYRIVKGQYDPPC